ncbi:hypothetical protein VTN00DRAFT_5046 [Thermoascus crustaceus]|uniref:uncharacterized protein n=1 Tax=Thermoascus crustaceus TaxID=5088 RepID=UPI003743F0D3
MGGALNGFLAPPTHLTERSSMPKGQMRYCDLMYHVLTISCVVYVHLFDVRSRPPIVFVPFTNDMLETRLGEGNILERLDSCATAHLLPNASIFTQLSHTRSWSDWVLS